MGKRKNVTRYRILEEYVQVILSEYRSRHPHANLLPVPVERIALESFNLRCEYHSLRGNNNLNGALLGAPNVIVINELDPFERQRFTIAHEIGHKFLHDLVSRTDLGRQSRDRFYWMGKGREESAANDFAAALLMPSELVQTISKSFKLLDIRAVTYLARLFQVSPTAMIIHIEHLDKYRKLDCRVDTVELKNLKARLMGNSNKRELKRFNGGFARQLSVSEAIPFDQNYHTADRSETCWYINKLLIDLGVLDYGRGEGQGYKSPADALGRPLVIEFAGTLNAGKDTQIDILKDYLQDVRNLRVKIVEESYRSCELFLAEETHLNKFYWTLGILIKSLMEVLDQPSKYDVIIFNRALLDSVVFLHFYHRLGKLSKKKLANHAAFLMTDQFVNLIDVVFLLTIPQQVSIKREEQQSRRLVRALVHEFDTLVPTNPPSNIANEDSLKILNECYDSVYGKYQKRNTFKNMRYLRDDGTSSREKIAIELGRELHNNLPAQSLSGERKDVRLAKRSREINLKNKKTEQLILPQLEHLFS